ncbi:hypothetical protein TanjilG_21009 [Lupinus angustifolius]|uniref:Uncharacterized protein n=1 Tax=Lupinus angustifolius TaxID=3871 RepID=A0A1J7I275_LUPAN|nr:hypothetical protein TanjilG_21009 [Lupinus angustifolius]
MSWANSRLDRTDKACRMLDKLARQVAPYSEWVLSDSSDSSRASSVMVHYYATCVELFRIPAQYEGSKSPPSLGGRGNVGNNECVPTYVQIYDQKDVRRIYVTLPSRPCRGRVKVETLSQEKGALQKFVGDAIFHAWGNANEEFHLVHSDEDLSWISVDNYVEDGEFIFEELDGIITKLTFPDLNV